MALVLNATNRDVQVQVQGAWFTFKPKQIKSMDDNKVAFLISNCANLGFSGPLPDDFEDPTFRATPEGKKVFAEYEEAGIKRRVEFLTYLKNNELNSLRQDMERGNDKSDPRAHMSPKMVEQIEELASYVKRLEAEKSQQIAKIQELEKLLEK